MEELKTIRQHHILYEDGDIIKRIEKQLDVILMDEVIYWKQRSRAYWLKEWDRNIKYFHAKASLRKRKNKI